MKKRFFLFFLTLCLLLPLTAALSVTSFAAAKITETVNLSRPEKNESGAGYYWDNRKDTLTLNGLYIETSDEFGLKVPQNATVILKGDNYITASRAALGIPGTITFKGDGTLTLVADEMGMYFYSTDNSTIARFLSGTYTITSGGDGIVCEHTAVSFVGSTLTINASNPEKYAVKARQLKLFNGKFTADNALTASVALELNAIAMNVTATKPALVCEKSLVFTDVSCSVGDSAKSLAKADAYNGELCISTKSTAKNLGHSALFGDSVPKFVDIILLIVALVLVAAGIGIPFYRTYKKNKAAQAIVAALEAEEKEKRTKRA